MLKVDLTYFSSFLCRSCTMYTYCSKCNNVSPYYFPTFFSNTLQNKTISRKHFIIRNKSNFYIECLGYGVTFMHYALFIEHVLLINDGTGLYSVIQKTTWLYAIRVFHFKIYKIYSFNLKNVHISEHSLYAYWGVRAKKV